MINAAWTELDSFVEAFERARAAGPVPDLTRFAPPPDHELHCSVLRELIRVDLEFGWSEGRPATLADYRRRYPNVFADADHAREIEFEAAPAMSRRRRIEWESDITELVVPIVRPVRAHGTADRNHRRSGRPDDCGGFRISSISRHA